MFNGSYYSTLLHVTILKGGYTAGECWMGVQTNSNILFITNGSRRADDGDNQLFLLRIVTQPKQTTTLWVLSVNSILGRCEAL